jgi:inhibitor of KinA sporulation pathway (predicted exonuclease)
MASNTLDYLVIMDFECTCDSEHDPLYAHEIIEFPAVLLDLNTNLVIDQFRMFVRPLEQPTLSDFCTELTGIQQFQVDLAQPLLDVLASFEIWLLSHKLLIAATEDTTQQGTTTTTTTDTAATSSTDDQTPCNSSGNDDGDSTSPMLVAPPSEQQQQQALVNGEYRWSIATDGPWDMEHFLYRQLMRYLDDEHKAFDLMQRYRMTTWVDIRTTFAHFFRLDKRKNIEHMLQHINMDFAGRQHSGLDDSVNLARIVQELIKRGCKMRINDCLKNFDKKQRYRSRHNWTVNNGGKSLLFDFDDIVRSCCSQSIVVGPQQQRQSRKATAKSNKKAAKKRR